MAKGIKTGGRQKGTPNKVTADLKALAQDYGDEAITSIVELARNAESEATRLAAWKELLDRAYRKATQATDNRHIIASKVRVELVSLD